MPSQAINSEDFQQSSNSKTLGGCAQMYNVKMLKITDTLGNFTLSLRKYWSPPYHSQMHNQKASLVKTLPEKTT